MAAIVCLHEFSSNKPASSSVGMRQWPLTGVDRSLDRRIVGVDLGSQAFRYVSSSNGRLQSELLIRPELIQWQLRVITNMQFELHISRSNNLKANHPTLDKHFPTGRKPASTRAVRKVRAQRS